MMEPACESGFVADENEASENARKRKSGYGIGLIVIVTSWCFLASCSRRLASIRFSILAWLIVDCRNDNLLERSGLVFMAAYCTLPTRPRNANLSGSVTGFSSWDFLLVSIVIGLIFRTYADWFMVMLKS